MKATIKNMIKQYEEYIADEKANQSLTSGIEVCLYENFITNLKHLISLCEK